MHNACASFTIYARRIYYEQDVIPHGCYKVARTIMRFKLIVQPHSLLLIALLVLLTACSPTSLSGNNSAATPTAVPRRAPTRTSAEVCPAPLNSNPDCYTLRAFRIAYGVETLTEQGFTGKGQTAIDTASYGSPTLQQDIRRLANTLGLTPIPI